MKVLFCNIAWMSFYKGLIPGVDEPVNGGSYVGKMGDAHEKYNFTPVQMDEFIDGTPAGEYCLGFVETKTSKSGKRNDLHIEKIEGCAAAKNENFIDDVLVIYCAAKPYQNFTSVVGWYKHARVFRKYECAEFDLVDGGTEQQFFNALAKKEDCVLLPTAARRINEWNVPRRNTGAAYGFGQANVWFAEDSDNNQLLEIYLNRLIDKIESYDGENWVDYFPQ